MVRFSLFFYRRGCVSDKMFVLESFFLLFYGVFYVFFIVDEIGFLKIWIFGSRIVSRELRFSVTKDFTV